MIRQLVILILALAVTACKNQNLLNSELCKTANLRPADLVNALASEKKFPGMAAAVAINEDVVWSHGYGFADIASSSPIDPDVTKFRIGSTSKTLTAYALSVLDTRNEIELSTPVTQILDDLPPSYTGINLKQLASHLGGVRHYNDISELGNTTEYATSSEAMKLFVDDELVAAPVSEFVYSTYGYTVISAALEELTDTHFEDIMKRVVIEPLGLTNTVLDTPAVKIPDRTEFYYFNENMELIIGDEINSSYKWAGGGYLASVTDLARFGAAHFDEHKLSAQAQTQLWTNQKTSEGKLTGYGLGWFIDDNWVQHPGGALGGSTLLRIYPEQEIVIALATNLSLRGENRFNNLPDKLFECFSDK